MKLFRASLMKITTMQNGGLKVTERNTFGFIIDDE